MVTKRSSQPAGLRWLLVLFGLVLAVCGAGLALGGARLISLGGSWYYLPAGLALVVAGVLYARRRPTAIIWLGAVFVLTLLWALAEVGFDYWQLLPRVVMLAVLTMLGLLLAPRLGSWTSRAPYALAGVLFVALLGVLGLAFVPHGVIREHPATPAAAAVPAAGQPADWRHYGRTPPARATRRSTRSTRTTSTQLEVAWTFRTGVTRKGCRRPEHAAAGRRHGLHLHDEQRGLRAQRRHRRGALALRSRRPARRCGSAAVA